MIITRSDIPSLLRPGLKMVFGDYNSYPGQQWKDIFTTVKSDKADEIEVELKFLGAGQFKNEGAAMAVDTMAERYKTTYHNRTVALSFIITQESIEDDLYRTQFPRTAESLKHSMHIAKEILGAAVLNNGFTTSIGGDRQPLFSSTHPIDTGYLSNTMPGLMDLTEGTLELAISQTRVLKDIAGLTIAVKPLKLFVSPKNEWNAGRILKSAFRTDTANNDINIMYNTSAVPQGYAVNVYLNDNGCWFLKTDAQNGFKHMQRSPLKTDVYTDFDTKNVKASAMERYCFGFSNWRAGFGVQAA